MSYLELLPAVDVKDGRAVRLVQGELDAETAYGNPLEVALEFQEAGAEWLHLVDLDAAFGRGENSALLAEVVGKLDIKVELSGGIRDDVSLRRALATGCRRVNLGTAALENPEWTSKVISEYGDRIAVGLDVRGHVLAARGWTQEGGDLFETIERLERDGCARYVVTDVTKDGTLKAPILNYSQRSVLLLKNLSLHRVEFLHLLILLRYLHSTRQVLKEQLLARRSTPVHSRFKKRWNSHDDDTFCPHHSLP
jgi:1-(5-phosphoribosyl)-5-[(5-phosphoribosylamino)methylideneamino] imidazole-4-carboxamide isomerase/N-(5'phosphoribosyl)anthranilate isomerase